MLVSNSQSERFFVLGRILMKICHRLNAIKEGIGLIKKIRNGKKSMLAIKDRYVL